ncbi:MAG TPA: hypothetical protein VGJ05_02045 [Fimbriiglobus sp.]|jgi:hypothetical protein
MHRLGLGLVVGLVLGGGSLAFGQDGHGTTYWPRKRIDFPVPIKALNEMNPRPEKLRFYAAEAGGRFVLVSEKTPDTLDSFEDLRGNKLRGFTYTARDDGEVTFATQRVYRGGKESPRTEDLPIEMRVVFDTRPPAVQLAALGTLGVEWDVRDENLDPDGVMLQARYKDTKSDWQKYKDRLAPQDKFTVRNIPSGYKLEVRIVAKDRAGNEMASRPVVLPADGVGGGIGRSDPGLGTNRGSDPLYGNRGSGRATSYGDDLPNRPAVEYVNRFDFTVKSKLTRVTMSGVKSVNLWVNTLEVPGMQPTWKIGPTQKVDIPYNTPDPKVDIPYQANADGLYGFIVIPVNGADRKVDDPRRTDPAQFLVEVDTKKPDVKIHNVKVSPGGATGAKVEIEYTATDKNLWDRPIILEYADGPDGPDWKPITPDRERNDGRYLWTALPEGKWKFYVRVRAVDKAGNTGENVYDKPVIVDLDRPEATIEKVTHPGAGGGVTPERYQPPPGGTPKLPDKSDEENKGVGGGAGLIPVPKLGDK